MVKRLSFFVCLFIVKVKNFFNPQQVSNHLLIVKVDAIGDYIVFRNYLQAIAQSPLYKSHKITLVGNVLLKNLVNELDSNAVDHFIEIDHDPAKKDWKKLIKEVNNIRYDTLINFHYSRTPTTELISFSASAKRKVTMYGDNLRISPWKLFLFNKMYSLIVQIPAHIKTEFEFNKYFTEQVIGSNIQLSAPVINIDHNKHSSLTPYEDFIIIAPAAAVFNRQLSLASIHNVVDFLLSKNYNICFIGSKADYPLIAEIMNKVPDTLSKKVMNFAGKTPLEALPYLISKSLGVICNDSGVYHMSVALNKSVLCFTGGGHFERFVNYVKRDNIKVCYEPMPCFNCNWKCIYKFNNFEPYPCINLIGVNAIYENISLLEKEWLSNNSNTVDNTYFK